MNLDLPASPETSLDPDNWQDFRRLGHRMVDDMASWLSTQRERPLHSPVPETIRASFEEPAPRSGQPAEDIYEDFLAHVLPYPRSNCHPRFWGWVEGSGTPVGMLADLLAAGMNSNTGFGDHSAIYVERQVLAWMRELFGYSVGDGGGILTSGCTLANLTGLTVARNHCAGWDVAQRGVAGSSQLVIYGSTETHSSVLRAVETLGLGRDALRRIPVDPSHRIQTELLRQCIAEDLEAGKRPVAIVGNAGTVNVGAFDDFDQLADIAEEHGAWLHIDGAFGALAQLSPELRSRTTGIERADSIAFDFHKWTHVPYDVGCVLFRQALPQAETFGMTGAYLSPFCSSVATGPANFMQQGMQMSRGFRALKVWMTLRHFGLDRLVEAIERNVRQARYLADQVTAADDFELAAPVPLNIVNLRFVPDDWDSADCRLDELNQRLLSELHLNDVAAPSHTVLDGRFVVRVAITNHRSRIDDFDLLVREMWERGHRLAEQMERQG